MNRRTLILTTLALFAAAVMACCAGHGSHNEGTTEEMSYGIYERNLNKRTDLTVPEYAAVSVEDEKYEIASDGGMIYNLLSREALKTGTLGKYDSAETREAVIKGDGFSVTLNIPKQATAYDMVPVRYSITREKNVSAPFSIEAVAYENKGTYDGSCYDLTLPGSLDISYEYLGYVTGTDDPNARNKMRVSNADTPAASYPDYTTTDFNTSGTVLAGDIVWLKFRFTNTGNTVLDCEGQGNFNIYPKLYKKSASGQWELQGGIFNDYIRELTYVYPGESREFWVNFVISGSDYGKTAGNQGLLPGDYRIIFTALYRSELDYNPDANMYHGRTMNVASYIFSVSGTEKQTKAREVTTVSSDAASSKSKTSWLHYFEEFMTTFVHYRNGVKSSAEEGVLWLQCAPWTDQVVVKVIYNNPQKILSAKFPISIETDSLFIEYNRDNLNVLVNAEGYEEPVICIQSMPDLRANTHISPYPEQTIINDLLTMQECGCNVTSWQGFMWLFDSVAPSVVQNAQGTKKVNYCGDALKFALDACRALGLRSLGLSSYPYGNFNVAKAATWVSGKTYNFKAGSYGYEADYSDPAVAEANAVVALYERERWGDLYYSDATGRNVYTIEDTRGLMRYEHTCRYAIGTASKAAFREWLVEKYGSLEGINAAWGTNYKVLLSIDPEKNQTVNDMGGFGKWVVFDNVNEPFHEWTLPLLDYDTFRTEQRIESYELFVEKMSAQDEGAAVQMRTEGSQFMAVGIDPSTTNPHYRQIMYSQLRGACISELIAMSDAITAHCDYTRQALTPSEVRELTRMATDNGIIEMLLPQFHDMRDVAINDRYGNDYRTTYNLTDQVARGAYVHQLTAVYPWWKATYESGGVPGVLWQDFQCNGFVTETQIKEMKFFKAKIDEMLADPEVKALTRTDLRNETEDSLAKQTFDPDFIAGMIDSVRVRRNAE